MIVSGLVGWCREASCPTPNVFEIPPEEALNASLSTNCIIVEDDAVSADVERQLLDLSVRQKDGGFLQRMSVTKLIEYIRIWWCDLGYDHI